MCPTSVSCLKHERVAPAAWMVALLERIRSIRWFRYQKFAFSLRWKIILTQSKQIIVEYFQERYPYTSLWLAGHTVGGSITSLVGLRHFPPHCKFRSPWRATRLNLATTHLVPKAKHIIHVYNSLDHLAQGNRNGCTRRGYATETKCHVGQVIRFEVEVPRWNVTDSLFYDHRLPVEMLEASDTVVPEAESQINYSPVLPVSGLCWL